MRDPRPGADGADGGEPWRGGCAVRVGRCWDTPSARLGCRLELPGSSGCWAVLEMSPAPWLVAAGLCRQAVGMSEAGPGSKLVWGGAVSECVVSPGWWLWGSGSGGALLLSGHWAPVCAMESGTSPWYCCIPAGTVCCALGTWALLPVPSSSGTECSGKSPPCGERLQNWWFLAHMY